MKWNCVDSNGELVAIVEADSKEDAIAKAKTLAPSAIDATERNESGKNDR